MHRGNAEYRIWLINRAAVLIDINRATIVGLFSRYGLDVEFGTPSVPDGESKCKLMPPDEFSVPIHVRPWAGSTPMSVARLLRQLCEGAS